MQTPPTVSHRYIGNLLCILWTRTLLPGLFPQNLGHDRRGVRCVDTVPFATTKVLQQRLETSRVNETLDTDRDCIVLITSARSSCLIAPIGLAFTNFLSILSMIIIILPHQPQLGEPSQQAGRVLPAVPVTDIQGPLLDFIVHHFGGPSIGKATYHAQLVGHEKYVGEFVFGQVVSAPSATNGGLVATPDSPMSRPFGLGGLYKCG